MSRTTEFYERIIKETDKVNYWLDEKEKGSQSGRSIDVIRFSFYLYGTGKNADETPMSAKNLNDMENWYLELARKEINSEENNDNDLISRKVLLDFFKDYHYATFTAKRLQEFIEELPTIPQTDSVLYPPVFIDENKIRNKIAEMQTNTITGLDGTVYVQDNDKQGFTPQTNTAKYIHIDDVYRLVAGHSDYHGDSILSAFTCITEGKNVKNITPLDRQTNTAEWIFPELVTGRYKCSHCRGNADRTTRFCPYCGYLMSNYNGKAE